MGPKQSNEYQGKYDEFFNQYQIIQEIHSENIKFLEHKNTKKQYLLRQLTYNDKKQYYRAIENIKIKKQKLKGVEHVNCLENFFERQQDQYCSTFYKIYVLFQYPQRTLDDQINERNLRKNPFTQTQLWSILASCILGLSHLQKKGIKHNALKSSMIFLSQEGHIKISDPFTNGSQTNYEVLLNKRNARHIYLSPQQCEGLQNQTISLNVNPFKSDIFTLGVIILQSGLLQYQDQCYRDQNSRIHWQTLQYNKNRFKRTYSQQLANMLEYMLGAQQQNRPQWIQLESYVTTDSMGKSFISQGRQSVIAGQSKPVSVNILHNNDNNKNNNNKNINNNLPSYEHSSSSANHHNLNNNNNKKSNAFSNNKPISVGKGIGISNTKPMSVKNIPKIYESDINSNMNNKSQISNYQTHNFNKPLVVSGVKSNTYAANTNTNTNNNNSHVRTHTHNNSNLMTPFNNPKDYLNNNGSNAHNNYDFHSQTRVQSRLINNTASRNQNQNQQSRRFQTPPLKVSNITNTRPLRSIFPNPHYQTKTCVDENLVQVLQSQDDGSTNRSMEQSSVRNKNTFTGDMNMQSNQKYFDNITSSYYDGNRYQFEKNKVQKHHNQGQFVIESFKLGSRYQGYKKNGLRNGLGKFYYQDGGMYDGNWHNNKMQGFGKLFYQSGKIAYQGQWVSDQFTGNGVLYNQKPDLHEGPFNYTNLDDIDQIWTKYQGQFNEDVKNGQGVLYLSNGQYFEGSFRDDAAQGQGTYITLKGQKIRGLWENNILIKKI